MKMMISAARMILSLMTTTAAAAASSSRTSSMMFSRSTSIVTTFLFRPPPTTPTRTRRLPITTTTTTTTAATSTRASLSSGFASGNVDFIQRKRRTTATRRRGAHVHPYHFSMAIQHNDHRSTCNINNCSSLGSVCRYMTTISNNDGQNSSSSSSSSQSRNKNGSNHKRKKKKKIKMKGNNNNSKSNNIIITQEEKENMKIEEITKSWLKRVVIGMNLCPFAAKPVVTDHQLYIDVVRGTDIDNIARHVLAQATVFTTATTSTTDDTNESQTNENNHHHQQQQQLQQTISSTTMPGTALIVCPELAPYNFEEFLDVLSMIVDGLFEEYDLNGKIQVVPFHPHFVFASSSDNSGTTTDDDDDEDEAKGDDGDDGITDTETDTRNNNYDDNNNNNKMEYWTNRSPYPMFHLLKEEDVTKAVQIMKGETDKIWQRNVFLLERMEELCYSSKNDNDNNKNDGSDEATTESPSTRAARQSLEAYLRNGDDDKNGTMRSLVKQALEETSQEFPMLKNPIKQQ